MAEKPTFELGPLKVHGSILAAYMMTLVFLSLLWLGSPGSGFPFKTFLGSLVAWLTASA